LSGEITAYEIEAYVVGQTTLIQLARAPDQRALWECGFPIFVYNS